jgi:dienelactone hydrolase
MQTSLSRFVFLAALLLVPPSVYASQFKIPWKGDYRHNSSKTWSHENPEDSGFSKHFLNGTPEEGGKVQKDGELWVETMVPDGTTAPIPFVVLMHGCMGMTGLTSEWVHKVGRTLNAEGIGVLILDSFTTRKVDKSCGMPDLHWARRRADDAYSALDYLIETNLAQPSAVYVMGQSGGGSATLVAMTKLESDHTYKFAAGFPVVPPCVYPSIRYADFYAPMVLFVGADDDANDPKQCIELSTGKRSVPVQVVVYQNANHGFMEDYRVRTVYGWTDNDAKVHNWTLSYNPVANKNMMDSVIAAIKTKNFVKGIELRRTF